MNKRSPEYHGREQELADALEAYAALREGRPLSARERRHLARWCQSPEFERLVKVIEVGHPVRAAEEVLPSSERMAALKARVLADFRQAHSQPLHQAASPFPAGSDSELLHLEAEPAPSEELDLGMPRVAPPARVVASPAQQARSAAAWVRLEVLEGGTPRALDVRVVEAVLGRGHVPIRLEGDLQISRRHARLSLLEGYVVVTDLDSRNGTYVNGRRVVEPTPLTVGDVLELGQTQLHFVHLEQEEPGYARALFRTDLGDEYLIDLSEVILGRSAQVAVSLQDLSRRLSRRHARLELRDQRVFLIDLDSTNGTYCDGRRIRGPLALEPEMNLRVGGVTLRVLHIAHEL